MSELWSLIRLIPGGERGSAVFCGLGGVFREGVFMGRTQLPSHLVSGQSHPLTRFHTEDYISCSEMSRFYEANHARLVTNDPLIPVQSLP